MSLSEHNEKILVGINPFVAQRVRMLIAKSYQEAHEIQLTRGFATLQEQADLYAQGRTKPGKIVTNAKPGRSYHNYGLAVDFAILKDGVPVWDSKVDVDEDQIPDYEEVGEFAEGVGLEWGGRFKSIVDLPHVQYTFGLSIDDLLSGKKPPEVS